MNLDVLTLSVMVSVGALSMGAALVWLGYGQSTRGLTAWGFGLLCYALGAPVLALRGVIAPALAILGGSALLHAALSLMLVSLAQFLGRQPRHFAIWGLSILSVLLLANELNHYRSRLLTFSLVLAIQTAWIALTVWRQRRESHGRGAALVLAGALAACSLSIWRAGAALYWVTLPDYTAPSPLQTLTHVVFLVSLLTTTAGFIGMQLERLDAHYQRLAALDELTGIPNRRALMEALQQRLAQAQREQTPLGVVMLDIDHFKDINDRHGHQAGDLVLQALTHTIDARLREQDTVGRYGGEEFLVLLPNTPRAGSQKIAQDLLDTVRAQWVPVDGTSIQLTISAGVQVWQPGLTAQAWDLIQQADQALYRAKEAGRDRVEMAQPSPCT